MDTVIITLAVAESLAALSPGVVAQREAYASSRWRARESWASNLPGLSASLSWGQEGGYYSYFPDTQKYWTVNLSVSQPILSSRRLLGALSASREAGAARAGYLDSRRENRMRAVELYFGLLEAWFDAEAQAEAVRRADEELRLAKARMEAGEISKAELRSVEASWWEAKAGLDEARARLSSASAQLASLLGLGGVLVPDTSLPPPDTALPSLDSLVALALDRDPGLAAMREREAGAGFSLVNKLLEWAPEVELGYYWRYWGGDFPSWSDLTSSHGIYLSLSFNLTPWLPGLVAERHSLLSLRAQRRARELEVESRVAQAWWQLRGAIARLRSAERALAAARESYALTKEKYALGEAGSLELLSEAERLARTRVGLFRARCEVLKQRRILEILTNG